MVRHGRELVTYDLAELVQRAGGTAHNVLEFLGIPAVPAQEDFASEVILARKVTVYRRLAHPSRLGYVAHAGTVDAALGKQQGRGPYDHRPLGIRLLLQNMHILMNCH